MTIEKRYRLIRNFTDLKESKRAKEKRAHKDNRYVDASHNELVEKSHNKNILAKKLTRITKSCNSQNIQH